MLQPHGLPAVLIDAVFSFIHLIFFEPASSKTGRYTLDFLASDQADTTHSQYTLSHTEYAKARARAHAAAAERRHVIRVSWSYGSTQSPLSLSSWESILQND